MNRNLYEQAVALLAKRRDAKLDAVRDEYERKVAAIDSVMDILNDDSPAPAAARASTEFGATLKKVREWVQMRREPDFTTADVAQGLPDVDYGGRNSALAQLRAKGLIELVKRGSRNVPGIYRIVAVPSSNGANAQPEPVAASV